MKSLCTLSLLFVLGASSAFAGFTEGKLNSAKRSAQKTGKLIAFVFYEDFSTYREPQQVAEATARNSAAKKAIPRADVTILEINKGDKDTNKIPACVAKEGKLPRVVITDAKCKKVIIQYDGAPNREKSKEIETKVEEALEVKIIE